MLQRKRLTWMKKWTEDAGWIVQFQPRRTQTVDRFSEREIEEEEVVEHAPNINHSQHVLNCKVAQ